MPNAEQLLFEARRYARREKFTHALKLFQQILDAEPNHVQALIGKGGCHYKLGHDIWARITWEQVLRVNPKNKKVKKFLARMGDGDFISDRKPARRKRRSPARRTAEKMLPLRPLRGMAFPLVAVMLVLLLAAPFVVRNLLRSPSDLPEKLAYHTSVLETFDENTTRLLP